MSTSKLNRSRMNRLFDKVPTRKDGHHEPMPTSTLARATSLKRIAASPIWKPAAGYRASWDR